MFEESDFARRATRMPESGIREIFDAAQEYDELYDMSIGEPDFDTPEPIAEAVRDAITEGVGSYTQTLGREELRESLSAKLRNRNGIDAEPLSELVVTPGAMGAIFTATQVLCEDGDEVLVPAPYWPNYEGHLANTGATLVAVPTTQEENFVPTTADIRAATTEDTVGILLNTPNNPTGAVIPPDRLREIGDLLAELELWGILDETYEDLVYDDATHHSLASDPAIFDRTITVHSFSKSYAMTGWRLGYASGPADVISAMRVLQEHTVSCAAEPSQIAASAALDHPEVVEEIHAAFADRRALILDRLRDIDGVQPGNPKGAFYVFADVSAVTESSRELTMKLLEDAQLGSVPGSVFGPGGEGFLRFSYATDTKTIRKAMDRFQRVVES